MKNSLRSHELVEHINRLTELWLEWMHNHRRSNDITRSFGERRKSGERCEILQHERQDILRAIDDIVEEEWGNE